MLCAPKVGDTAHDADPALSTTATQPAMLPPPSLNVTVPVTIGPPTTVAVYWTPSPNTDGLALETTVVDVALTTVSVSTGEVLVVKLPSPLYTAVMPWTPAARALVAQV